MVFDGLYGVFNDSLPDGWGRLLLDRTVVKHGVNRRQLTVLGLAVCLLGACCVLRSRCRSRKSKTIAQDETGIRLHVNKHVVGSIYSGWVGGGVPPRLRVFRPVSVSVPGCASVAT